MNIMIRNLDPIVVQRLNQIAKDQKVSREELLRRHINTMAMEQDIADVQTKSERILEAIIDVVERNNMALQQVENKLDMITTKEIREFR